ncbi:MAG TPA: hypothetical protein PLS49_08260 [Candidatus Woesebacteria bacterium]|nr:hypothetical protein [Candidatus Woesebacteria bacterium]
MGISNEQLARLFDNKKAGFDAPRILENESRTFNEFEQPIKRKDYLPMDFMEPGDELVIGMIDEENQSSFHVFDVLEVSSPIDIFDPHKPVFCLVSDPETGVTATIHGSSLFERSAFTDGLLKPGYFVRISKEGSRRTGEHTEPLDGGWLIDFQVNRLDFREKEFVTIASKDNIEEELRERGSFNERPILFGQVEEIFSIVDWLRKNKDDFLGKEGGSIETEDYVFNFETLGVEPLEMVTFLDKTNKRFIKIEKVDPTNVLQRNYKTYTITVFDGAENNTPIINDKINSILKYNISTHPDLDGSVVIVRGLKPNGEQIRHMGINNPKNKNEVINRTRRQVPTGLTVSRNSGRIIIEDVPEHGTERVVTDFLAEPDLSEFYKFLLKHGPLLYKRDNTAIS